MDGALYVQNMVASGIHKEQLENMKTDFPNSFER